jgi:CRISPR-associated endonuclease Cas2
VQASVFEGRIDRKTLLKFKVRLLKEIDLSEDSLRIYTFDDRTATSAEVYGNKRVIDLDGPLIG